MSHLIRSLSQQLERPIIDKTGLSGNYDFTLNTPEARDGVFGQLTPEAAAADPNNASIFTALQEQLGIKLESTKGPIQILVIDRAEKPATN